MDKLEPAKPSHPALFLPMEVPFGAATGYLGLTFPYLLGIHDVSLSVIGALSATANQPHSLKFLWVPLLDLAPRRKLWYLSCVVLTAVLLAAAAMVEAPHEHATLVMVLLLLAQISAATSSAALNALVAITCKESDKGRAGGFYMAGNLGGYSLLGALGIWLQSHTSPTVAGLVLGGVVLATGAFALPIVEPRATEKARASVSELLTAARTKLWPMFRDLWDTVRSREGLTGLIICLAPIGCGGLANLFTGMAPQFHASEHVVEVTQGLVGAITSALGSVIGGVLADRMNRRIAYGLSGAAMGVVALAMTFAPMNQTTYVWGTLLYGFAQGIAYATWAGMVLEMVGHTAAVASKYALFTALANQATNYTQYFDGAVTEFHGFGVRGALGLDALMTLAGLTILLVMVKVSSASKAVPAVVPAPAEP